jgi:SAM-dependent methyltransferase
VDASEWNERYRPGQRAAEDLDAPPTPLLVETARGLKLGRALDLACGAGRNALWMAEHGWNVTAVDASEAAIEILRSRAEARGVTMDAQVADLEKHEFQIENLKWDFIAICYYLQRDLIEPAKQGLVPGGILLVIVHITDPGEEPTAHRLRPGELKNYFGGWEIVHNYEGQPNDIAHRRGVGEIVTRRPTSLP